MQILLISPLGFPINSQVKYAGIEKLVWQFTSELVKEHQVTVLGHADSIFPEKVKVLPIRPESTDRFDPELKQFQVYQSILRNYDVVHDFSHLHLASRFVVGLPSLNIFWHAPSVAQYPKAPYNIVALSNWATKEFRRVYKQEARYQQSICVDVEKYKPLGELRNNRFLCVGRMGAEKGNLEATILCQKLGVPLDIVTACETKGIISDYAKQVMALADGDKIKIWWEQDYTEETKIKMMQTNKALLYVTNHPEVTSHKIQESLLCGMPVIVPYLGALPEIVTNGVDGYLCRNNAEFVMAMDKVDLLKPEQTYEQLKKTYSVENVIKNYIPLYEKVKGGLRW